MISVHLCDLVKSAGVLSTAEYMADAGHKDHAGKFEIGPERFHNCTNIRDLAEKCETLAAALHAIPRRSGHKWGSDIAQHWTFSFPSGVRTTAAERRAAEAEWIATICPDSPAMIAWHTPLEGVLGDDEHENHEHAHLLLASATTDARHRVTEQRRAQACGGARGLMRLATAAAVEAINQLRLREGRALLATPSEAVRAARERRRLAKGHEFRPVSQTIAEQLALNEKVSTQIALDTLRGLGWGIRPLRDEPNRVYLTPPQQQRPILAPYDLLTLVCDTEATLAERREKARAGKDAGIAHQHDTRPTHGMEVES